MDRYGLVALGNAGGAIAKKDERPVGTLAWVKWDSNMRRKQNTYMARLEDFDGPRNNYDGNRRRASDF